MSPSQTQLDEGLSNFPFLLLRVVLEPKETLRLPAWNKGNTLRGAFGASFRRLVCVPQCRSAHSCPLAASCPYKRIFEPSPPPGSERLSKNQDVPRPFVFRPPADSKTTYEAGETFEFELVLLGVAVDFLPYFVLSFRDVMNSGFGLNRARCELTEVRTIQVTGDREQVTEPREQSLMSRLVATPAKHENKRTQVAAATEGGDLSRRSRERSEPGEGFRPNFSEQETRDRKQSLAADSVSVPSSL
ncbi:MAG: hypothetical protein ACRD3O_21850, partial [Terriglobia bacterium]